MNILPFGPKSVILVILLIITICFFLLFVFWNDGKLYRQLSRFYQLEVKRKLVGEKMSRASFTFAHGFFVCLMFFLTLAASWWLFRPGSEEIANKFIKIGISSPNDGKLAAIYMNLSQPWKIEGHTEDEINRDFTIWANVDRTVNDTVEFEVRARSNFDATFLPDTLCALSMEIDTLYNMETRFNVKFADRGMSPLFVIKSDASIFDDEEHPFVNFYLSFEQPFSCLPVDSLGNVISGDSQLSVYLNSSVDANDLGDLPYDVVAVKPEPETNCPYDIGYYTPEKVNEVLKKGIYISTVNRDLKAKKDRETFLFSVLIGAAVSFLLTIVIELLTKWRNLNEKAGRKNPYD